MAFGNHKWAQYFGADVVKGEDNEAEFSSLCSSDIIADCKKLASIFPKRHAKDTFMLVRIPSTLTLEKIVEFAGEKLQSLDREMVSIWENILSAHGNKLSKLNTSYWVLMTKDALPESTDKSYGEQEKIVAELAKKSLINYEVPEIREAAACMIMSLKTRSKTDFLFTRCKEQVEGGQTAIDLRPSGLNGHFFKCDDFRTGIAALRKFY